MNGLLSCSNLTVQILNKCQRNIWVPEIKTLKEKPREDRTASSTLCEADTDKWLQTEVEEPKDSVKGCLKDAFKINFVP